MTLEDTAFDHGCFVCLLFGNIRLLYGAAHFFHHCRCLVHGIGEDFEYGMYLSVSSDDRVSCILYAIMFGGGLGKHETRREEGDFLDPLCNSHRKIGNRASTEEDTCT
jgi:hypothetical protein